MYTVETIVNDINSRGYRINSSYVQKMLKETIKEGSKLKKELTTVAKGIDFTNNREVITFINKTLLGREAIKGKTISNKVLEELYIETGNEFFKTLIGYRKSNDRYTKVTSLIKHAIDPDFNKADKNSVKSFLNKEKFNAGIIYPQAKVNASGGISLSNPSLPFCTVDIKKLILYYNVAISCKSMEEVLYILNKYGDLLYEGNYLVVGTSFYADIMYEEWYFIPFPISEGDDLKHMEDFRREFLGEEPEQEEKRE